MFIRKLIKYCILKIVYGPKVSPEAYYKFPVKQGMNIGEGTIFLIRLIL